MFRGEINIKCLPPPLPTVSVALLFVVFTYLFFWRQVVALNLSSLVT